MIFFDIDETLLDFKGAEFLAVQSLRGKFGEKFNLSESDFYRAWCDIGQKHFNRYLNSELTFVQQQIERAKEFFGKASLDLDDTTAYDLFQEYVKHFENNWKPFDDVVPCLESLKERGLKLGIISNGDYEQQTKKLEKMGVMNFFEVIVVAGEVGAAKPNKKIFEIACERAALIPNQCTYIGDDLATDILSCVALNMKGIWLNRNNVDIRYDGAAITNLHELKAAFL